MVGNPSSQRRARPTLATAHPLRPSARSLQNAHPAGRNKSCTLRVEGPRGQPAGTCRQRSEAGAEFWPRDCKVQAPDSHQLLGPVAAKLVLSSFLLPSPVSSAFVLPPSSLSRSPGGNGARRDTGSFSPRHIWGAECLNDPPHPNQMSSALAGGQI